MRILKCASGQEILIDDEDYDYLSRFKWHFSYKNQRKWYVQRSRGDRKYNGYMHRELMQAPKNKTVDHIDGNTLNNQKSNLRVCSYAENMLNVSKRAVKCTSKFLGVHLHKLTGKYRVQIKGVSYGLFATQIEAAIVRDKIVASTRGEFAKLNFNKGSKNKCAA